ncbi:1-phosphatidylinositol-3-phosphate 5-kinase FAB1B [Euphorbia peplus]|nr:1-phosphatidylinositol-3-phosphate 5-kinase FAB1B [Euphorbia peplus]
MCSMCHNCGAHLSKSEAETRKSQNGNHLQVNGVGKSVSCRFCQEKQQQDYTMANGVAPHLPIPSPSTSLSSSDRSVSSCSDISVDVNAYDRGSQDEGTADRAREDTTGMLNEQLHKASLEACKNGVNELFEATKKNLNEGLHSDVAREIEIMEAQETRDNSSQNSAESLSDRNELSCSSRDEMDSQVWEPPESEDPEDDLVGSVAFDDEDDDYGDGTEWGKPTSLSCSKDEVSRNHRFNEEKRKAMEEVAHGKFKSAVRQLLKTSEVFSMGKDRESWVDIVSSLSWDAASFFKPTDGKGMNLDGYVKVKCIATGSRSDSQVVKGLVFKKHAAHKHMPTSYKNPRLLLIEGVLGQSSSGLSSFKSMELEKDNQKLLIDLIETCHPNVVLVEKSVSRDVQESILAKGMTLVYDMKLHRLKRVSQCTGSPLLSSDSLAGQKLKNCDSFHIEKFVEEHACLGEGGKKPSKTLMFIEGCPTRLGCTILLKGSHSDELKRIKYVVQIAVIMAYHLILETSFLVDWRAMFSTVLSPGTVMSPTDVPSSDLGTDPCIENSIAETEQPDIDISISNGSSEEGSGNLNIGLENNSMSYVPYNPVIFSGFSSLSASLRKVIGENFPIASAIPYQSLSNYFGLNEKDIHDKITNKVSAFKTLEAPEKCGLESNLDSEKSLEQPLSLIPHSEPVERDNIDNKYVQVESEENVVDNKEDQAKSKDEVNSVLNSQSILVLMSSRNALRGTMCEQSHFSHIMFYENFDVPLGNFFRDNLLNQRRRCSVCDELPEAHFYYYAHHDKQLTIRVKQLKKHLPGEAEGKLWMWSCCGKCTHETGVWKCTKRVLVSNAAHRLSFGKFLELSFSQHPSFDRLSTCGHSTGRDFIYFFGLGPMVSMFRYSLVTTYSVSLPPLKMEFSHSIKYDGLKREFEDVYSKGKLLFNGIGDSLMKLRCKYEGSTLNLQGSLKLFPDIEHMLKQESSEFEANMDNFINKNGNADKPVYLFLSLNRVLWELLLESCIWEKRLNSLLLSYPLLVGAGATGNPDDTEMKPGTRGTTDNQVEGNELLIEKIPVNHTVQEPLVKDHLDMASSSGEYSEELNSDSLSQSRSPSPELSDKRNLSINHHDGDGALSENLDVERTISIAGSCDPAADSETSRKGLENSNGWFWRPFSEIRQIYIEDLDRNSMPKFQSTSRFLQEHVPAAYQLINEEGQRLHIHLGNYYIIRDRDGELSTVIACALAVLKDITENSHLQTQIPSRVSSHWSSFGSSDSDSFHSMSSVSQEESRFSSFDGLNLLESLVPPENPSPEVLLGAILSGKRKYSVVCLCAKQFRDLRARCCPSEGDYIASLSRCMNWDAKGGKSKSVFSKTLDERFIIKEIKKTEFESFVKFAPHYFKYMNESFEVGNQTCLAKVLGIYQVTIRQGRNGKETRHDLMVMENLSYGRKITRQYDLKGALHARYSSAADGSGDVLLDQNFVNDMNSSPLYVSNKSKRILERAVWNDTTFLNSINVMDYSLLVGVDTERRQLVCGIIDYLRQYTWDKQLETWVKSSLVVPKNVLPTVISPKEYKKRFRKFMAAHFLSVPDDWCSSGQRSSDPYELWGVSENDYVQSNSKSKQGSL